MSAEYTPSLTVRLPAADAAFQQKNSYVSMKEPITSQLEDTYSA